MKIKTSILFICAVAAASAIAAGADPAEQISPGIRHATDAYPGFDTDEAVLSTSRKSPGWLSWFSSPEKDSPAEQLAFAEECVANESWRAARKAYDALVTYWPTAPEAPVAQRALADLYLNHYAEYENAFKEYKYLMDYYPSKCDFNEVSARLYAVAKLMREEGKTLMFFRFANTTDVRRAFEAVVVRAPGASFTPEALLTIGQLREDDQDYVQAALVYENIRNQYAGSEEARTALMKEARVRMTVLGEHEYNRDRCKDTISFLKFALTEAKTPADREELNRYLEKTVALLEEEAFTAAKFYDSTTRTKRSAITAYERFLREYPASRHAEEVNARLMELQYEKEGK